MVFQAFTENEPMSLHTTFRIGGPARYFVSVSTPDDLTEAIKEASQRKLRWLVIGQGSNILAPDKAVQTAIISYMGREAPKLIGTDLIKVSGATPLSDLVAATVSMGLSGAENLAGIPGTVGGAIAGNAGAYGTWVGELVQDVDVIDRNGNALTLSANELKFEYRGSMIKKSHTAILSAHLKLARGDSKKIKALIEERLVDRKNKHPDPTFVATAGSFFKNPTDKNGTRIAAGKLLEEAGCKTLSFGSARVWHKHANIIVADTGATSRDVKTLAEIMRERVVEKFGVELVPEVYFLD